MRLLLLFPLLAWSTSLTSGQSLRTELVADGYSKPVQVTSPPGDSSRLFVLEQYNGQITILKDGKALPEPFLDIKSELSTASERGLLGMAFHPQYSSNGRFFVNFTDGKGYTQVWEYAVSKDPDVAKPERVAAILEVPQPYANHNGGCLVFGPDGKLYIGLGDGGAANDPANRSQDLSVRLGKMLRLDVDLPAPHIPADNPFVGREGVRGEIWAYGMRNPWRYSFDRLTGDLWIGDVGQNKWEEIHFQPASSRGGENYGWRCMEANHCTNLSGCECDDPSLTPAIHEYPRAQGCSITGGFVYRGPNEDLQGTYFFGDYCSGRIWSFHYDGSTVSAFVERTEELDPPGEDKISAISSFGEDALGNLYIIDYVDGQIFRIIAETDTTSD